MQPQLSHSRVLELLDYDPATGIFRWRFARRGIKAGEIAGGKSVAGYITLSVDKTIVYAHRLAIFYVTGQWPVTQQVDHRDGVRDNNAFANLRQATAIENNANRKPNPEKKNPKGVFQHGRRFRAAIKHHGKYHHLGCFDTAMDAHVAYVRAANSRFGEFARPSL